jgi:hypothetical protein
MVKYEITTADNGFVVTQHYDSFSSPTGEPTTETYVFEAKESDPDNLNAVQALFFHLKEQLADSTSRYSERRLFPVIIPGDKNEKFTKAHADILWPEYADEVDSEEDEEIL